MPDRIVREGIIDSEKVNALSFGAEVFYRRLLNKADDFGLYWGNPKLLLGHLFALQVDRVKVKHIEVWILECRNQKLVEIYEVDSKPYLKIENFGQRLRQKRQRFPMPSYSDKETQALIGKRDSESLHVADNGPPEVEVGLEVEVDRLKTDEMCPAENSIQSGNQKASHSRNGASYSLRSLVTEILKEYAGKQLGEPPEGIVLKIIALLEQNDVSGERYTKFWQDRYDADYQPRKWPWFFKVTANGIKEGELVGSKTTHQNGK